MWCPGTCFSEIWLTTFHNYVQPIEEPILSEFCTNLTGITQEQVEIAAPLGATLMRFNTWLKEHCSDIIFNAAGEHIFKWYFGMIMQKKIDDF